MSCSISSQTTPGAVQLLDVLPDDACAERIAARETTPGDLAEQHAAQLLASWPPLSAAQAALLVRVFGPRPHYPVEPRQVMA